MFDFLFKKRDLLPLPYKRELHCHIIPGVDDGSRQMSDSLDYMLSLQRHGVERVIFTPHHTSPRYMNTPEIIQPLFDKLKEECQHKGLTILPENYSFEYRVDETFLEMMQKGKCGEPTCALRPLYGKYILIEGSFSHPIPAFDEVIDRLLSDGWYLILAHPERYLYYAGSKGRFYHHLQERQVEFQCNILSFAGYYGEVSKKMAYWMLEQGYVNFLGSDLHTYHHTYMLDDFLRSKDYASIYDSLCDSISNDQL
ncbi:MAG: hypothetical protein IJP70_04375 [Bacteroidales bacterium]|nr:hypothetical protein [Bacteroidales bacterium]